MPTRYFPLTINGQLAGSAVVDGALLPVVEQLPRVVLEQGWLFWAQYGSRKIADVSPGDITRVYWTGETPVEHGPTTRKAHLHRILAVDYAPHKTGNVEHHSHYIHLDIRASRDWINRTWTAALTTAAEDPRATPEEARAFAQWAATHEPGGGRPKGVYYYVSKPTSDAREAQRYLEYARKTVI